MSYALLEFMQHHSGIETVQQNFCEPGHSSIQEVDNIHSQIENRLKNTKVFSPISVVQQLLKVNFNNPLNVIQMKANDFKEFQKPSKQFTFKGMPYAKVKILKYHRTMCVQYKTTLNVDEVEFQSVPINNRVYKTRDYVENTDANTTETIHLPQSTQCKISAGLSAEKSTDIRSTLRFMPGNEQIIIIINQFI